ncbi:ATP-grasp domain-containing protein [Domibacillus indicus]|uniref:ATP-grasp domain-containing protein n=1 Tax=Domibacillus indicus TaxID=1437523 RepID=UPI000617DE64|nr:ATP-grasp domain-containing protein [Domibacillus indicus]
MGERAWPFHSFIGMIQPEQSSEDIYGKGYVYSPKLFAHDYEHFGGDLLSLEALTGRELGVAGEMPVICHEGTVTPGAVRLLEKAGLHLPSFRYTYRNDKEYVSILQKLSLQGKKVIFQYPHPPEDAPAPLYWVDPSIIAYLSDKRSIPALVPAEHVPPRRMVSLDELLENTPPMPFILKTGDGRPTSGGCGVLFIERKEQLYNINEDFGDLSTIILEEYIEYERNFGFHYAADQFGNVRFLGKSEQVVNQDNCFRGSWISTEAAPFERVVEAGLKVMQNIAAAGYTGVAGFDVLIRGDEFYFIDLNVRFNASSCGLMLYETIRGLSNKPSVRLSCLEWYGWFEEGLAVVEKYMDQEQFIPLSLLDAACVEGAEGPSKIIGLVLGRDDQEVEDILNCMEYDQLTQRE